jgi:hypothetical protein
MFDPDTEYAIAQYRRFWVIQRRWNYVVIAIEIAVAVVLWATLALHPT